MNRADIIRFLRPGDCLLYRPSDLFGWLIALKTFNMVSHVEVYAGAGESYASRNGFGVDAYPFRDADLCEVYRPRGGINWPAAADWFQRVRGQKYDWLGLLCFTLAVRQGSPDKMFCSECATRLYRAGGVEPFQAEYDADHVPPAYFRSSAEFKRILCLRK